MGETEEFRLLRNEKTLHVQVRGLNSNCKSGASGEVGTTCVKASSKTKKPLLLQRFDLVYMAEKEGFEPSIRY